MVQEGIEIASGRYADTKVEEAIKNKSALVAMCATVVMYQPQNREEPEAEVVPRAEVVDDVRSTS